MSREDSLAEPEGLQEPMNLRQAIPKIAYEIARLDPGPAAALRRGPYRGAGAAAFWKLLAKHKPVGAARNEVGWAALVQAIAVLTPKGRDSRKQPAHDYSLTMGQALHDAGISELRLARLLAAAPELRGEVAVRVCRRLAAGEPKPFNLVTLGDFVLRGFQDTDRRIAEDTDRRIARDYYRAYAAAERKSQEQETPTDA